MSTPCDRLERAELAQLGEESAELAAHLASCPSCASAGARYQRLTDALARLGDGAPRRTDHVARVLATAAPSAVPPRRWLRAGAASLALAAALALVWWLRRAADAPPRVDIDIDIIAQAGPPLRGDAALHDRVEIAIARDAALWVYRNERELLLACPRDCRRDGARQLAALTLDQLGSYQVVWLSTAAVPPPAGELERDVAAARAAGARHELRELEVQ
jgi:hypothetical protein